MEGTQTNVDVNKTLHVGGRNGSKQIDDEGLTGHNCGELNKVSLKCKIFRRSASEGRNSPLRLVKLFKGTSDGVLTYLEENERDKLLQEFKSFKVEMLEMPEIHRKLNANENNFFRNVKEKEVKTTASVIDTENEVAEMTKKIKIINYLETMTQNEVLENIYTFLTCILKLPINEMPAIRTTGELKIVETVDNESQTNSLKPVGKIDCQVQTENERMRETDNLDCKTQTLEENSGEDEENTEDIVREIIQSLIIEKIWQSENKYHSKIFQMETSETAILLGEEIVKINSPEMGELPQVTTSRNKNNLEDKMDDRSESQNKINSNENDLNSELDSLEPVFDEKKYENWPTTNDSLENNHQIETMKISSNIDPSKLEGCAHQENEWTEIINSKDNANSLKIYDKKQKTISGGGHELADKISVDSLKQNANDAFEKVTDFAINTLNDPRDVETNLIYENAEEKINKRDEFTSPELEEKINEIDTANKIVDLEIPNKDVVKISRPSEKWLEKIATLEYLKLMSKSDVKLLDSNHKMTNGLIDIELSETDSDVNTLGDQKQHGIEESEKKNNVKLQSDLKLEDNPKMIKGIINIELTETESDENNFSNQIQRVIVERMSENIDESIKCEIKEDSSPVEMKNNDDNYCDYSSDDERRILSKINFKTDDVKLKSKCYVKLIHSQEISNRQKALRKKRSRIKHDSDSEFERLMDLSSLVKRPKHSPKKPKENGKRSSSGPSSTRNKNSESSSDSSLGLSGLSDFDFEPDSNDSSDESNGYALDKTDFNDSLDDPKFTDSENENNEKTEDDINNISDDDELFKDFLDSDLQSSNSSDSDDEKKTVLKKEDQKKRNAKPIDGEAQAKAEWKNDPLLTASLNKIGLSKPNVCGGGKKSKIIDSDLEILSDDTVSDRSLSDDEHTKDVPDANDDDENIECNQFNKHDLIKGTVTNLSNVMRKPVRTISPQLVMSDSDSSLLSLDEFIEGPEHKVKEKVPGRKNIRKMLTDQELREETKKALIEETARLKRIEIRNSQDSNHLQQLSQNPNFEPTLVLEFDVSGEPRVATDPSLYAKMKKHQIDGVKFMWNACFETMKQAKESAGSGCILAHCMGLGKTLQVITLVHTLLKCELVKKVLVISPSSIVLNWENEFKMWLGNIKSTKVHTFILSKSKTAYERASKCKQWLKYGGVMLINYSLYRQLLKEEKIMQKQQQLIKDGHKSAIDSKKYKRPYIRYYRRALCNPGPDLLVCDEGHLLKNSNSAINRTIDEIATKRRIILTGTPMQNNLREYYHMVNLVKPNLLGSYDEYTNRFVNPITNGQHADSLPSDIQRMKARSHVLHKLLSGILQRREMSVLIPYLPKLFNYVVKIRLSSEQNALYKHYMLEKDKQQLWDEKQSMGVKQNFSNKTLFKDHNVFKLLLTHPLALQMHEASKKGLSTNENTSSWWSDAMPEDAATNSSLGSKLTILFSIINECEKIGEKVIVFSSMISTLDTIEFFLQKASLTELNAKTWAFGKDYARIDGKTERAKRFQICNEFNNLDNRDLRLLLATPKCCGMGFNITGANRCVIMDMSWNPTEISQSISRMYRFGQTRICYVYLLIAVGTMEETIYERSVNKEAVACRVVDEQQIDRHFESRVNDKEALYRYTDHSNFERPAPSLPADRLLAALIQTHVRTIWSYHEHDQLLQNQFNEELEEHEREEAWKQFQKEEERLQVPNTPSQVSIVNNNQAGPSTPQLGASTNQLPQPRKSFMKITPKRQQQRFLPIEKYFSKQNSILRYPKLSNGNDSPSSSPLLKVKNIFRENKGNKPKPKSLSDVKKFVKNNQNDPLKLRCVVDPGSVMLMDPLASSPKCSNIQDPLLHSPLTNDTLDCAQTGQNTGEALILNDLLSSKTLPESLSISLMNSNKTKKKIERQNGSASASMRHKISISKIPKARESTPKPMRVVETETILIEDDTPPKKKQKIARNKHKSNVITQLQYSSVLCTPIVEID